MWPRAVEVMLGFWLLISPLIFAASNDVLATVSDLACGSAVIVLALLSFWRRTPRAHWLVFAVAGWLFVHGYWLTGDPPPPHAQNHVLVSLLLAMHAVIPNRCTEPPAGWLAYYDRHGVEP